MPAPEAPVRASALEVRAAPGAAPVRASKRVATGAKAPDPPLGARDVREDITAIEAGVNSSTPDMDQGGPKDDPPPPQSTPTVSSARERQDVIRGGVTYAQFRDHYRAEFEALRRVTPTKVNTDRESLREKRNRAFNVSPRIFDAKSQWTINRYASIGYDPSYPEHNYAPDRPTEGPYDRKIPHRLPSGPDAGTELIGLTLRNVGDNTFAIAFLHNNPKVLVEDCDFTSPSKTQRVEGRFPGDVLFPSVANAAIYAQTAGPYTWRRTWVENLGSHGSYFANRPWPWGGGPAPSPPKNRFFKAPQTYLMEDSYFFNCDQHAAYGSFAVQWFNPGDFEHPGIVIMDGFVWGGQWPNASDRSGSSYLPVPPGSNRSDGQGMPFNTRGAFTVFHYSLPLHDGRRIAMGGPMRHPTDSFTLKNFSMWASWSEFPIARIDNTREISIKDGAFHAHPDHTAAKIFIDMEISQAKYGTAELVVVENVLMTGSAGIRIVGKGPGGADVEFPQDLVGKIATWRPGMATPEVRSTD